MPVKQMFRAAADWLCSSGSVMDKWGKNPHLGKAGNYLASPQTKLLLTEMIAYPAVSAAATGFTSLPHSAIGSFGAIAFLTIASRAIYGDLTKLVSQRRNNSSDTGNYYITKKRNTKQIDPKIIFENLVIRDAAKYEITLTTSGGPLSVPATLFLTGNFGFALGYLGCTLIQPAAHWYRAQQVLNGRWTVEQNLPRKRARKRIQLPVLFRPQMQPGFAFRQASPSA